MPVIDAVYLLAAVLVLAFVTERWRLHSFLAIVVLAAAFGLAAGMSIGQVSDIFSIGFVQILQDPGLVVITAGMIAAMAEGSGAMAYFAPVVLRSPLLSPLMALLGLVAGAAASRAAAFAVLNPLRQAISGANQQRSAVLLGLAVSASHGVLLPSPIPIAALAILDGDWGEVLLLGLPVAVVAVIAGAAFARWGCRYAEAEAGGAMAAITDAGEAENPLARRGALALIIAAGLMTVLLIIQSLGSIPSEPFGGGSARHMLIGVGRPLTLLLVALGLMLLVLRRGDRAIWSGQGWLGRGMVNVTGLVLVMGAGGGWQKIIQETGMAELLGERLLDWHVGLLLPVLVAAVLKILQGSSLVAAITAAGMVEPLLTMLGLDTEAGRALAVLAVGIGAVTGSHVNDDHFWVVSGSAGMRPWQGLRTLTLGTLVQCGAALLALFALAAIAI